MTTTSAAGPAVAQALGQPVDRLDVEVVGRLVEHQQVVAAEQQLGQRRTAPLAAGQARPTGRSRSTSASSTWTTSRVLASAAHSWSALPAEHVGAHRRARVEVVVLARGSRSCSPRVVVTRPESGVATPVSTRSRVVLPLPLRPTTPIRSPSATPEADPVEQRRRAVRHA